MKLHYIILALLGVPVLVSAGAPQARYVKQLTFPSDATLEQRVEMAANLVPSEKQLNWQRDGLTAFLHFGVNTFTDREWGDGSESPAIFNPDSLDADQWVRVLKDAGFKQVILTAKHHDGFCLWPTATTDHSVKSSPWLDGKGDVMAMLRKACDKYGMKLGVYLSPWDRNAACYGDSPAYNDMFVAQLTELLSNYGRIDEVWFDGACGEGPNGKKQEYDWQRFSSTIEQLQPGAVMAIMGDDVRWVGNEKGQGRETEWSATALTPGIYSYANESNQKLGLFPKAKDLGSRELLAKADKLYWWPSEVDVSIRPGWFYHDKEQPKSLRQLAEIYLTSVGRNSVLLLNIPPDRHGLIPAVDAERLMELRAWLDANIVPDLADSYTPGEFEARMSQPKTINAVSIGEDISKGQHVEDFTVEALIDGNWQQVADGSTIGFNRILMFPDVEASAVRVTPGSVRGKANISSVKAHHAVLPPEKLAETPGFHLIPTADWTTVNAHGDLVTTRKAYDGTPDSYWKSAQLEGPKTIVIDTGREQPLAGFVYTPRGDDDKAGTIYHYSMELSNDGVNWQKCPVSGEFSNIAYNPLPQMVYFPTPVNARYVRFSGLDEIEGRPFITIGELQLLQAD